MKKLIEWLEGDPARGRKFVLIITVFVFLFVTIGIVAYGMIDPTKLSEKLTTVYMIFTGLMASIYGFYTGTSADKSSKLADKAADLMMKKLDKIGNKDNQ